jgi:selenocysteine lyase/cysteine desulfurase
MEVEKNSGVVSLQFEGVNPQTVANRLDEQFRVQVRPGLHCSPWAHESFGSYPEGTVRFSFGFSNTSEEIKTAIDAVRMMVP